jgi:hypothetical protein
MSKVFRPGYLKEKDKLKNLGVERKVTQNKHCIEIGPNNMDWIHLADRRDNWQADVNTVTNIRCP